MQLEGRNMGAIIQDWAELNPQAASIEDQGHRHSRADIMAAAQELAVFLRDAGVGPGSSIAVLTGNAPRGIETMIAAWSLQAAVLFLDPRQPLADIARAREAAGLDAVFTDLPAFARKGAGVLLPDRGQMGGGHRRLTFTPGSEQRNALILSSSGTTSLPRYRRVRHDVFVQDTLTVGRLLSFIDPPPTVLLSNLAFGAVLGGWIRSLICGKFLLCLPPFVRVADLHNALCRRDIGGVSLPPVMIRDLLAFHGRSPAPNGARHYPHLIRMSAVGGPIASEDLVDAYRCLTDSVLNIYSMTGVGAVSILENADILAKPGSVGKPLAQVSVWIKDATGDDLPVGQTGRIFAKADWRAGAEVVDTGDIGWIDADGFLYVAGRSQQVATRNSVNVNLRDLENDVKALPEIRDCIAFARAAPHGPDDEIVLAIESGAGSDAVRKMLIGRLPAFRRPDKLMVVAQLPRNAAGKLLLRALQQMANEEDSPFADIR